MQNLIQIRPDCDRWVDYMQLMELEESSVREAVDACLQGDLLQDRSSQVASLLPDLIIKTPAIDWATAEEECRGLGPGKWHFSLVATLDDPSSVMWSVELPVGPQTNSESVVDAERGTVVVTAIVDAKDEESAHQLFGKDIEKYKENLLRSQLEFERFNAALPYLISYWIEARLSGVYSSKDGKPN